jgi:hypothetical protein
MQRVHAYQFPRHGYRIAIPADRDRPSRDLAVSLADRLTAAARYLADAARYRHAIHATMLVLALAESLTAITLAAPW